MKKRFTCTAVAALLAAAAGGAHAAQLVGLTSTNELARFSAASPGMATMMPITGLMTGDRLVGIDLRPSNNTIYGITLSNRIYTIDEFTGAASFVAALSVPVISAGAGWGLDFNPERDYAGAASLRLVGTGGGNHAVNVDTGVVGNVAGMIAPGYSAVAYSNSMPNMSAGPASTALYYINSTTDMLDFAPGAFNAPTITAVGPLGVDVLRANGFELTGNNIGYAALNVDGASLNTGIYRIDLASGQAMWMGDFNGTLSGLTVSAVPEPESYALMMAGLGWLAWRVRRRGAARS